MLKWTFVSLCNSDRSQGCIQLRLDHTVIKWSSPCCNHKSRRWACLRKYLNILLIWKKLLHEFKPCFKQAWGKEADPTSTLSKSCKWLTKTIFTMCLMYYFAEDCGYDSWSLRWGKTVQARSGVGWIIVVFKCWRTYHLHIISVFEYCCFADPEMNAIKKWKGFLPKK